MQACRRPVAAERIFRDLCNRAVLHVLARERVLLPAWRLAGWKHLPSDAMAAHMAFKHALADLMVQQPGRSGFAEALEAFAAGIQRQHDADSHRLVPALRIAMDLDQRRALCNDIEVLYAAGSLPPQQQDSPRELIEEAEVFLTSLAVPVARPAP